MTPYLKTSYNSNRTNITINLTFKNENSYNSNYVEDECACKQTYTMINGKCEIDQNWCDSSCRGYCIESNNQVVCSCSSSKYKLNENTGNAIKMKSEEKMR